MALDINRTEARQLLKSYFNEYARRSDTLVQIEDKINSGVGAPNSDQRQIREMTQSFVRSNWQTFAELLSCNGDCASMQNNCTDAQAFVCYRVNKSAISEHQK
jgi:hypothetical protein